MGQVGCYWQTAGSIQSCRPAAPPKLGRTSPEAAKTNAVSKVWSIPDADVDVCVGNSGQPAVLSRQAAWDVRTGAAAAKARAYVSPSAAISARACRKHWSDLGAAVATRRWPS